MSGPTPSVDSPVIITTATDMAHFLRSSSPENAVAFATAAHELACWSYDDGRVIFWERVVEALAMPQTVIEAAA